jgi:hypothetical protein
LTEFVKEYAQQPKQSANSKWGLDTSKLEIVLNDFKELECKTRDILRASIIFHYQI